MDGLRGKTLLELMIWGYPYFWKHPYRRQTNRKWCQDFLFQYCIPPQNRCVHGTFNHRFCRNMCHNAEVFFNVLQSCIGFTLQTIFLKHGPNIWMIPATCPQQQRTHNSQHIKHLGLEFLVSSHHIHSKKMLFSARSWPKAAERGSDVVFSWCQNMWKKHMHRNRNSSSTRAKNLKRCVHLVV